MSQPIFKKLTQVETKKYLGSLNPQLDMSDFKTDSTVIMAQVLSFLPGCRFLDISDKTTKPEKIVKAIVNDNGQLDILDFTAKNFYEIMEKNTLDLNTGTVQDYAHFFFDHVRGAHGRFTVVETLDDIRWQEEPPLNARKAISKMIVPLTVTDHFQGERYILQSTMVFRDALIKATLDVDYKGLVRMYDEELIVEDMPIMDDDLNM